MMIVSHARPVAVLFLSMALSMPMRLLAQEHQHKVVALNSDNADLDRIAKTTMNTSTDAFEKGVYKSKDGQQIVYRLMPPAGDRSKRYPLVVLLHGSGAVGTDNNKHMGVFAKMWAVPDMRQKYPAYVLAPQFPSRSTQYEMDKSRGVLASTALPTLMPLIELVDSLRKLPGVDASRVYLVGYSMGGSTTINALSLRPDIFAAAVSIAGIPQFNRMDKLSGIPIWLIHGNADKENAIASNLQFYKEMGDNSHVMLWEFDKAGHEDVFSSSVIGEYLPQWLFGKTK